MKYISIIFFSVVLISCDDQLDRSIFKQLTVEELNKSIKKDSLFEQTYKYIQFVKDSVLKTDLEKAKWADLTYSKIHRFVKFSNDTNYFKPIKEKLEKDWIAKYGKYKIKVDSISDYWKKYKEANSLEQYVKIELVQLDKEYYQYIGGVSDVNLGFQLTPLKGTVDQVRFGFLIEPKLDEDRKYRSIYSSLDKSWCLSTAPFSSPVTRFWEANYRNKNILETKTLETLKRDYNILIEVDKLRKDGINMSVSDLKIPESVDNHWKYENEEYLEDLYIPDIVKELLNEEYIPKYQYRSDEINKILKKKDSLSFQFLKLNGN
jgi:hypothetical protein